MFQNRKTGEKFKPTLSIHLKYFFLAEERYFGIVLVICVVMAVVLTCFLGYHLRLARSNQTTNESFKRDEFKHALQYEKKVLKELIKECEDWVPKKLEDGTEETIMPPIRVDGELMP